MRVSVATKRIVANSAKRLCEYCHSQEQYSPSAFSVEHIVPTSLGGHGKADNLALSCQECNNHKYTAISARDPLSGEIVSLFSPRSKLLERSLRVERRFYSIARADADRTRNSREASAKPIQSYGCDRLIPVEIQPLCCLAVCRHFRCFNGGSFDCGASFDLHDVAINLAFSLYLSVRFELFPIVVFCDAS